jgi:hypothetical protein
MNFLLQTIHGRITLDFVFAVEQSLDFLRWKGEDASAEYSDIERVSEGSYQGFCPVGTLEFVQKILGRNIVPLNVPASLLGKEWSGRDIWNYDGGLSFKIGPDQHFFKSRKVLKHPDNGIRASWPDNNDSVQVSSIVTDIVSEWRCFVKDGVLYGIQNYSGDFTKFPDTERILKMISQYEKSEPCPNSYTLDVYMAGNTRRNINRGTFVMEVHPFVSVGLYGFSDYRVLPYMFAQTWFQNILPERTI